VRPPPLTPLAAATLHVPVPERALVVECGDGDPVLFLAREFPAARVRGADSSPDLVRAASARVGLDPEGRVAFKLGKPSKLPYPDGFFDLVALVRGRPAVREIARVLGPEGHLILVDPRSSGFVASTAEKLLRRRLSGRGFAVVETGEVGGGKFTVARRGDNSALPPSD
jgi:SAM-dependent methyltransferase